jgi:hypothetical protein
LVRWLWHHLWIQGIWTDLVGEDEVSIEVDIEAGAGHVVVKELGYLEILFINLCHDELVWADVGLIELRSLLCYLLLNIHQSV